MGKAREAGHGNLDKYYAERDIQRKRQWDIENARRREARDKRNARFLKSTRKAVKNGIQVSVSSSPVKGETEFAKTLRKSLEQVGNQG